jgi:hypothetical protein
VIPNASSTAIFQNGQQGYDLITAFPGAGYGLCKLSGAFDSLFFRPSILSNNAESIFPAPDSGYLTSGVARAQVGFRAGVGKLSPSGFVLWQNYSSYSGFFSYGRGSVLTPNNDLVVVGVADSGGVKRKALLIKFDSNGNLIWEKVHGDVINAFNPVVLPGGYLSVWYGGFGTTVSKFDLQGNLIQDYPITNLTTTLPVGIYPGNQNQFYLVSTRSSGGMPTAVVTMIDSQVNTLWTRELDFSAPGVFYPSFLTRIGRPSNDGGILILGDLSWYSDSLMVGDISKKQLLIKLDANGDKIWEKEFGINQHSLQGRDIRVLPDGRILAMSSGPVPNVGNQYYTLLAEFGPDSTTSIRDVPGTLTLTVQPQPARDLLEIALSAESAAKAAFTLTDLQGRTLIRRTEALTPGENRITLPVSQLAAGIYLLRAQSEGKVGVKKVIVE